MTGLVERATMANALHQRARADLRRQLYVLYVLGVGFGIGFFVGMMWA